MSLLAARDLVKSYGHRVLLQSVSLVIEDGERVGLLGPNGAGKSTLLRILAGREQADSGERTVRRDLELGFLEQEPELPTDRTIRQALHDSLGERQGVLKELDEIHAALESTDLTHERMERLLARQSRLEDRLHLLGGHDVEHRIESYLSHLGITDPDAPCGPLSGGEKRRVALARLLLSAPEILLLDEPTNHLDAIAIDWLEDFLLESRIPLLMVTHDRYFLDRVADRIIELDRSQLYSYDGGYGDFLVARAARLEAEGKAEASRMNILRRETAWMKRGPPARTTKQKARIRRYQQVSAAEPIPLPNEIKFSIPPGPKLGNRAIRWRGVHKSYGDREIVKPIDLEIGPGTRLGIVGPNGAGKTTFLKMVLGEVKPDGGIIDTGPSVKFGAVAQQRTELDPAKSVLREIAGPNDHVQVGDRMVRIETFLDQLLFPGSMKHQLVGKLSGGERNRVILGKLLISGGNVLLLDEPTNDLDLSTLRQLEEALCDFPGAVLVVSHDRYFLDRVATKILVMDGNGEARLFEGALSDWLRGRQDAPPRPVREGRSARTAPAPAAAEAAAASVKSAARKLSYRESQELEALPAKIAAAESTLTRLDLRFSDPELYTAPLTEREALIRERKDADAVLQKLYSRWEELESLRMAAAP